MIHKSKINFTIVALLSASTFMNNVNAVIPTEVINTERAIEGIGDIPRQLSINDLINNAVNHILANRLNDFGKDNQQHEEIFLPELVQENIRLSQENQNLAELARLGAEFLNTLDNSRNNIVIPQATELSTNTIIDLPIIYPDHEKLVNYNILRVSIEENDTIDGKQSEFEPSNHINTNTEIVDHFVSKILSHRVPNAGKINSKYKSMFAKLMQENNQLTQQNEDLKELVARGAELLNAIDASRRDTEIADPLLRLAEDNSAQLPPLIYDMDLSPLVFVMDDSIPLPPAIIDESRLQQRNTQPTQLLITAEPQVQELVPTVMVQEPIVPQEQPLVIIQPIQEQLLINIQPAEQDLVQGLPVVEEPIANQLSSQPAQALVAPQDFWQQNTQPTQLLITAAPRGQELAPTVMVQEPIMPQEQPLVIIQPIQEQLLINIQPAEQNLVQELPIVEEPIANQLLSQPAQTPVAPQEQALQEQLEIINASQDDQDNRDDEDEQRDEHREPPQREPQENAPEQPAQQEPQENQIEQPVAQQAQPVQVLTDVTEKQQLKEDSESESAVNTQKTDFKSEIKALAAASQEVIAKIMHSSTIEVNTRMISALAAGQTSQPVGLWFKGLFGVGKQQSTKESLKFKTKYSGGIIGVDTMLNDDNLIGIAYSHAEMTAKFIEKNINSKLKADLLSVYLSSYLTKDIFLNSQIKYGNVKLTNTGLSKMKTKGKSFGIREEFGYQISFKNELMLVPTIGLSYEQIKINGFKNKLAKLEDITSAGVTNSKLDGLIGLTLIKTIDMQNYSIIPSLYAKLDHTINQRNSLMKITFTDQALNSLVIPQQKRNKNTYLLGGGIKFVKTAKFELGVNCDLTLRKKFHSHTGSVKMRVNF